MGVLRNAFVPVLPDMDRFEPELKARLAQIKADKEGDKLGKDYSTSLTRRIDRELKAFHLPKLDLDADPRGVVKAVEESIREVERLRDSADDIELRLKANKALGDLGRFKKSIGDLGPEAAEGFSARFSARLGPLMANLPIGGPISAAIGVGVAASLPTLGAAIAGGVVGGAAGVGIIGGVKLAARDPRVKAEGAALGAFLLSDLSTRAEGFVDPVLDGIQDIRAGWRTLGPDLDRVFGASRFVQPLVGGVLTASRRLVGGIADAVDKADPVMDAFGRSVGAISGSVGKVFSQLSGDATQGASAIDDLTGSVQMFIETTGGIVHGLAQVKGWTDQLDVQIDKARYKIEDWGYAVDLTADGFKQGSVEAEAYRRVTLGTATAADRALLAEAEYKDVLDGGNETKIKAAESSLVKAKAEAEDAAAMARSKASADELKTAQQQLTAAQQANSASLDLFAGKSAVGAKMAMDQLKAASDKLYGAAINQTEANEAYQASWDALTGSVKTNKGTLDIHTAAGRTNRDALEALLASNNDLYYSNIASGQSTDTARKAHEKNIDKIRRESADIGLNRTETDKLIRTYGKIPPKKTTDVILDGIKSVVDRMFDIYLLQRAAAEGKTIDQIRGGLGKSAEAIKGRYAEGGWTGPGGKHDPAGVVHADEYVIKKSSRKRIEQRAPGLLDEMNATGQVPGYAAGGTVAPVDTSRSWPFRVDLSRSKVMSKADALAKVAPQFGGWPAGPGSQRGDSGVWRKVLQLIRSGPKSGSFGNAYRPGDPLWHGSGRAVDWMGYNQDPLATYLASKRPLELIHRTQNRDYAYTRGRNMGSFNNSLMEAHRNHIHIAMDQGGYLQPGWNPPIYNGTGRKEPVVPGPDIDSLATAIESMSGQSVEVRVFIGDREITDIVRTEVSERNRATKRRVNAGSGNR